MALGAAGAFLAMSGIINALRERGVRMIGWVILGGLGLGQGVMESFDVGGIFSLYVALFVLVAALNRGKQLSGLQVAKGVGLVAVAGTAALVWLMVRNRAWQRLVLDSETDRASGFDTAPAGLAGLVSESGVAQTPLRPSGRAQFGEQFVDVVTEGDFIDSGTRIEVLSVNGNRVVVQEQAAPAGVDAGAE